MRGKGHLQRRFNTKPLGDRMQSINPIRFDIHAGIKNVESNQPQNHDSPQQ